MKHLKKIYIDVMILGGAKFYCSLIYCYNPKSKPDPDDLERYVDSKYPTLKYRNDVVLSIKE